MTEHRPNHDLPPERDLDAPSTSGDDEAAPVENFSAAPPSAPKDRPEIRRPNSLDPWVRYKDRSQRVREEIARNRRGEYKIPTWGLGLIFFGMLAVWAALIYLP